MKKLILILFLLISLSIQSQEITIIELTPDKKTETKKEQLTNEFNQTNNLFITEIKEFDLKTISNNSTLQSIRVRIWKN